MISKTRGSGEGVHSAEVRERLNEPLSERWQRPMRFRKLRIAWSVVCGILCLLLILLWVRSYRWTDSINYINSSKASTGLLADSGVVVFVYTDTIQFKSNGSCWNYFRYEPGGQYDAFDRALWSNQWMGTGGFYTLPFWALVTLLAAFAAVPWLSRLRWRFSLRTLLIATTLFATMLGLLGWLR
jgi:hypothetical protein